MQEYPELVVVPHKREEELQEGVANVVGVEVRVVYGAHLEDVGVLRVLQVLFDVLLDIVFIHTQSLHQLLLELLGQGRHLFADEFIVVQVQKHALFLLQIGH